MRLNFTWHDAWVLAAITVAGGRKGSTLREIIASGDVINGAIFAPHELRRGIAKLVHAGYVMSVDGGFAIAGRALSAAEKVPKKASPFAIMQFFEDFLEADPFTPDEVDEPDWPFPELTDDRIITACASYGKKVA
jgi:hypothetical protein